MFDLSQLNPSQKKAVIKSTGPSMILAGAGSGKTKTLVAKISYLISKMDVKPYNILAMTFSNKAAREMRERIIKTVGIGVEQINITTFHSFCAKYIRISANHIGLSRNFSIYDTSESKAIVKSVLKQRGISTKEINPSEILYYINELKNNGYYIGRENYYYEVDDDCIYFELYKDYEQKLHNSNALDFGGLLSGMIELFEKHPSVLKTFNEKFRYILIDEYQDTNRAQFDIIKYLTKKTNNICVVGDEDQSIYSWRGADINNIFDFEKLFSKVEIFKLEQNYRSTKNIIESASFVIKNNKLRKDKKLWTDNKSGDLVDIVECSNDKEEADYIADQISKYINDGVSLDNIAIFYRANYQARVIEDSLRKSNISYKVIGGIKFYERKEIKDIISYLRFLVNENDSIAFTRIINSPPRGIGITTLRKFEEAGEKQNTSLYSIVENILEDPSSYSHIRMNSKSYSSLKAFFNLFSEARLLLEDKKPSFIYKYILENSGYLDYIKGTKDYEAVSREENLQDLLTAIIQYESNNVNADLLGFLETISLDTSSEEDNILDNNMGSVSLMTVHAAKGLEFPYVFLSGVEENVFPSYMSIDNSDNLEEERRLFYVAMTRAMNKLSITFACGRMIFGKVNFNANSRFIDEIPDEYYRWVKLNEDTDSSKQENTYVCDINDEIYEHDDIIYQVGDVQRVKYPKGSIIIHTVYGKGRVFSNDGSGEDEKISVIFSSGSKKKFLAKYAPIKLLE